MHPNLEPPPPSSPLPVLPMDIIVEIFCRLPVKTLLRFKCLSKQFLSLINSSDFINHHLQFSSLSPKLILYEQRESHLQFQILNTTTLDEAYDVVIPFVDRFHNFDASSCSMEVIGSCDGLLALSNRCTGTIILCNILTRKHKILPSYLPDCIKSPNLFKHGFGRGACFDDYKLVRVASSTERQDAQVRVASSMERKDAYLSVYSLKTDSWRKIADLPSYLTFTGMSVLVKGTLNWLCWERQPGSIEGDDIILSFDLNNDNFFFMTVPASTECDGLILTVGGECLCLLEELNYKCNIWMMKEYGVKDSWIKMYSLLPYRFSDLSSFAFSKHVDKFFFITDGFEIFLICDDDSDDGVSPEVGVWYLKEKRCEIRRPLLGPSPSALIISLESLVSPGIVG